MSEKTNIEYNIKTVDLALEKLEVKDKKVYIISKSLTKDFEPPEVLEMLAEASKNKHYIWRHRHPIDPEHTNNHIYGDVINSWVEDGAIYSKYLIFDHTNDHKKYIELLMERDKIKDPLGLSMRYRKYFDKKRNVIHTDVFEHSGTPFPACEDCGNIKMGVIEMTNENKDKAGSCPNKKGDEEMSEVEIKKLEESNKKIKELEALLNSKTEAFEKLEAEVKNIKKDKQVKDEELEKAKTETKSLEDTVNELEATVKYLMKKPLIDRILELKPTLPEELIGWYKTQDEKFIESEIKRFEVELESKPQVKDIEESANENDVKVDKDYVVIDGKKIMKDKIFEYSTQNLNLKKK